MKIWNGKNETSILISNQRKTEMKQQWRRYFPTVPTILR